MPQKALRNPNRRGLLLFALAAGGVWGGGAVLRRYREARLSFVPDPQVPGFRRIEGGEVSLGAGSPLIGLGGSGAEEVIPPDDAICGWLFPSRTGAAVAVAYFWDFACPFCRPMTRDLQALEAEGVIDLNWHHTPVFGPASEQVARLILAAENQGAGKAMRERVARGRLRPGADALAEIAQRRDVDPVRLADDMDSERVSSALARSRGLARMFALPGTPALVVGRTVVVGLVPPTRLRALLKEEMDHPTAREISCG